MDYEVVTNQVSLFKRSSKWKEIINLFPINDEDKVREVPYKLYSELLFALSRYSAIIIKDAKAGYRSRKYDNTWVKEYVACICLSEKLYDIAMELFGDNITILSSRAYVWYDINTSKEIVKRLQRDYEKALGKTGKLPCVGELKTIQQEAYDNAIKWYEKVNTLSINRVKDLYRHGALIEKEANAYIHDKNEYKHDSETRISLLKEAKRYFEKSVNAYEAVQEEKERQRTFKEYTKAMYHIATTCLELQGLCRYVQGETGLEEYFQQAHKNITKVFQVCNLPFHVIDESSSKEIANKDFPIAVYNYYYLLAKFVYTRARYQKISTEKKLEMFDFAYGAIISVFRLKLALLLNTRKETGGFTHECQLLINILYLVNDPYSVGVFRPLESLKKLYDGNPKSKREYQKIEKEYKFFAAVVPIYNKNTRNIPEGLKLLTDLRDSLEPNDRFRNTIDKKIKEINKKFEMDSETE